VTEFIINLTSLDRSCVTLTVDQTHVND